MSENPDGGSDGSRTFRPVTEDSRGDRGRIGYRAGYRPDARRLRRAGHVHRCPRRRGREDGGTQRFTPHSPRHFTDAAGVVGEAKRSAFVERFRSVSPLGTVGTPGEVAHAIVYLVSDASRFLTGQILRPNGGQAVPG